MHLDGVMAPERPFLAVVAGAKYDTKIRPLNALYDKVDRLVLGGVIYNTYLCAKYQVRIKGVTDEDRDLARELVEKDRGRNKIVELPCSSNRMRPKEGPRGNTGPSPSGTSSPATPTAMFWTSIPGPSRNKTLPGQSARQRPSSSMRSWDTRRICPPAPRRWTTPST